MWSSIRNLFLAVVGGLVVAACGADVGEGGARLVVDEARVTSEVLYMLPDASQVPFTAAELSAQGVDPDTAIPVRVEVFESAAVAWFAPEGEARIGSDWIIALWAVERVPASDDALRGGTPTESRQLGVEPYEVGDIGVDVRTDYHIRASQLTSDLGEAVVFDFLDRLGTPLELHLLEEVVARHPGFLDD